MDTRQLLAQLDAARSAVLAVQRIQTGALRANSLLCTAGRAARSLNQFRNLAHAMGQINRALAGPRRRG